MKVLKTILKVLLSILFLLIVVVAGAGYYVIHHPKETWAFVENRFLPKDLKITWESLDFDAAPQGARLWIPSIDFRNLCVVKQDPHLEFCTDHLQMRTEISLQEILHPNVQILNLNLTSNHENFFVSKPDKKPAKEAEQSFYEIVATWQKRLQKYSKWIQVHQVQVAMSQFELRSQQSSPLVVRALLRATELIDMSQLEVTIEKAPKLFAHASGELSLKNFMISQGNVAHLKGELGFSNIKSDLRELDLKWDSKGNLLISLNGDVQHPKIKVKNSLEAELNDKLLVGNLSSTLIGLKKPFQQIKPIHLSFHIPQEKGHLWSQKETEFKVSSLVPVFFVDKKLRPKLEKACHCQIPEELAVDLDGRGRLKKFLNGDEGDLFNINAKIQTLTNSLFSTKTAAQVTILRKDGDLNFAPFIDAHFVLNSFSGLVTMLSSQQILVPTPLSAMDGKVTLDMHGPVERSVENWKVPFAVVTDLASSNQRMNVLTQGFVDTHPKSGLIDANIDVLLRNVVLQLPPLDPIYGLPKITPDQRIEVTPPKVAQKKASKFKLRMALHVHTQNPNSLQFLYPLAKPSIPIDLNLNFQTGSAVGGHVSLATFKVDYLKRQSTIEKLQITLNEPQGNFPINGRFRVDQSLYKIYIDVLGNLKAPHVVLSSDPYLDRSDIISVLLYGRTNDQLVGIDAKTVGSFDAAMADRAIGLIGLWAFASTPIQSFSYNQLSKQYSAQVKLANDTTLAVGTNWEEAASLEIQKRLSDHWLLSASLEPNEEDQQTRKIRLQWEDRF